MKLDSRCALGLLMLLAACTKEPAKDDVGAAAGREVSGNVKQPPVSYNGIPPTGSEVPLPKSPPSDVAALEKIATDFPVTDAKSYSARGAKFLLAGEKSGGGKDAYERALKDFDKAIELDSKLIEAHANRGTAHTRLGKPELAIVDYTAALALDPKQVRLLVMRASAHSRRGDDRAAVADYTAALKLSTADPRVQFNRGNAYLRLGDKAKAAADFRAVAENADDPLIKQSARTNLASLEN